MNRIKLLFYAINGTGLGHLTRLLAVARSVREHLGALGLQGDLRFVTSSEASDVAWDFPVYKLPSRTIAREVGLDQRDFESSCRLLITNLVGSFSPHILIVDTVPQGSYREVAFLRGFLDKMIYIDRHKDPSVTQSDLHRRHVSLYDKILVPDNQDAESRYSHPKDVKERRVFVGPIHGFCPAKSLSPDQVRQYFGVTPGQRVIYISGGGGSDSRELLREAALALSADPQNFLLIGYGPLHRGDCLHRPNVVPLLSAEVRKFFPGVDAALSAAGYNSYQELLAAGVPTVFYAQEKGMDRQDERLELGRKRGWHLALPDLSVDNVTEAIGQLLDGSSRESILRALEERPKAQGQVVAGAEILSLHSSRPDSPVNRQKLYEVALWRLAWQTKRDGDFLDSALILRRWQKHILHREALEQAAELSVLGWHQVPRRGSCEALLWAAQLHRYEPDLLPELIRAWSHNKSVSLEEEKRLRHELQDVLGILQEHFELEHQAMIDIILTGFKRPYQKQALTELSKTLDTQQEDGLGLAIIRELQQRPKPWGSKDIEILKHGSTRKVRL